MKKILNSTIFIFFIIISKGQDIDSLKKKLSSHPNSDTTRVKILNRLSWLYVYNDPDSAMWFAKEANKTAQVIKFYSGDATSQYFIGIAYYLKGNNKKAEAWLKKALTFAIQHDLKHQQRSALNILGGIYQGQGDYIQSIDTYLRLLNLYEGESTLTNKDRELLVAITGNLATTYSLLKDFDNSIKYSLKSHALADTLNNDSWKSIALMNIGTAYLDSHKYHEAISYFQKALKLNAYLNNNVMIVNLYGNMGLTFLQMDSLTQAAHYIEKSFNLAQKIDTTEDKANAYTRLASLRLKQNRPTEALKIIGQALELLIPLKARVGILDAYRISSDIYSSIKNYKMANLYLSKAYYLQDSLLNGELTTKVASMLKGYELAKKQTEINELNQKATLHALQLKNEHTVKYSLIGGLFLLMAIVSITYRGFKIKTKLNNELKDQNIEIKNKNELLASVNEDLKAQSLRAQMNPHFIFNALTSIQGLLAKNNIDAANTYLIKFSDLMRSLLNNTEKRWISLAEEIETLKRYIELESLRFNTDFNYEIRPDIHTIDDHIPPMVVQPFVENAILHGLLEKAGEKTLHVLFSKQDGRLICEIIDNGVGRKATEKATHRNPTHESKGIKLIEQRLKVLTNLMQSDSGIEVIDLADEQQHPTGTKVVVTFPSI